MRPCLTLSSSAAWLARQNKDVYVRSRGGYRARSAFKLEEIEAQHHFIEQPHVHSVVDLGAAPGGWSQVASALLGWSSRDNLADLGAHPRSAPVKSLRYGKRAEEYMDKFGTWSDAGGDANTFDPLNIDGTDETLKGRGTIVALDLLPIAPIPGVKTIQKDFLSSDAAALVHSMLKTQANPEGKAEVILSDMAANLTGNATRDSQSSLDVCEAVYRFAVDHLRTANDIRHRRGGALLLKHFAHPLLLRFREEKLEPYFNEVKYIKPASSRSKSSEGYWLCQGWRGRDC